MLVERRSELVKVMAEGYGWLSSLLFDVVFLRLPDV